MIEKLLATKQESDVFDIKLKYYESNVNKYLFWIAISYNRKK